MTVQKAHYISEELESIIEEFRRPEVEVGIINDLVSPDVIRELEDIGLWSNEQYSRNMLYRDDNCELLLLCWGPGQMTAVHCHNSSECMMYGFGSGLVEVRYELLEGQLDHKYSEPIVPAVKVEITDEEALHMICNPSEHRLMTIHKYVPAIDKCRKFDAKTSDFVWEELSYDQIIELKGVPESVDS